MQRRDFTADTSTGRLGGWVAGEGPRVLAIHGGPGLGYDYLDAAVLELADHYEVATFQQRGIEPSTTHGEYTITEAVADLVAVLDGLGWDRAYLMGHSWGGHLAFHAAAAISPRLLGVLAVDPLGVVGDGGAAAFGTEMFARVPEPTRTRARELDEKDTAGTATTEESLEGLRLVWPSYFADPGSAPPMPRLVLSQAANTGLWGDLVEQRAGLEESLSTITVPVGVLVGGRSPMPTTAGSDVADRIPGGWTLVEPDAGHFVWHEAPGCVAAAMDRLTGLR